MKKILLVNQTIGKLFFDIIKSFESKSYEVFLFSSRILAKPNNEKINLIISFKYVRNNIISRLFTWSIFSIHYFLYLLFSKINFILVSSNPPFIIYLTAFLSIIRKRKFVVLVYDIYPDLLIQMGFIKKRGLFSYIFTQLNIYSFRRASKIITLSDSMKKALIKYTDSNKIFVIPNWADNNKIFPIPNKENIFIKKHKLDEKLIIMYSGNMGLSHDLLSVIKTANNIKSNYPNVLFLFIGDGAQKADLIKIKLNENLSNVLFLPYQDQKDFTNSISAADINIISLGVGAENASVPSKTYSALAAGSCILGISNSGSEIENIIEQYNVGINCLPNQPEILTEKIVHLIENPTLLKEFKKNARIASYNFTPKLADEYVKIFDLL